MSLPKSEISGILYTMSDILTRLIDRIEKNIEFQPFERRELLNTLYKKLCGIQIDEILTRANEKHKLQIKRGDTTANDTYTGLAGEITMDTDTKTIRIHDGETVGGVTMARAMDIAGDWVVESQLPTAENNYTWYRKYKSGWVEMGGWRQITMSVNGSDNIIALPQTMASTNYTIIATLAGTYGGRTISAQKDKSTTNTISIGGYVPSGSEQNQCCWVVFGISA